jgi:hypothetical protein
MASIPPPPPLASAAVVFFGRHGAVSRLARRRGVCRQRLYREAHALAHAVANTQPQPQSHRRRRQPAPPSAHAAAAPLAPLTVAADQLTQFAATAQALGVSLSATQALLAVLLGQDTPSVSTLGRLAQQAARRAGAALAVLDEHSRGRARQVAADELFAGKRPVLMTLEQESLCWLGGRLADDRDGATWAQQLRALPHAEQLTRDGGQGLRKGLQLVNRERQAAGAAVIADQDDHFHLLQRARRALREVQAQATRALRRAEQAQRTYDRVRRQGQRSGGLGRAAYDCWRKAEQAFDRWATQEDAFGRLRAALRLFTPAGELNSRARAEAEVAAALAELTGPEWERARRRLAVPQTFTFLDRLHEQLAALPLAEPLKAQVVRCEGLKRRPEVLRGEGPSAAALRGLVLAVGAALALLGEAGTQAVAAVRGVLAGAWRASSLVEGLNSVVRMHQGRQKRLTQGLLDLKRLHWNVQQFRAGQRRGQSPYGRLGVVLPEGGWWQLLSMPPEQLREQLSALNPAA